MEKSEGKGKAKGHDKIVLPKGSGKLPGEASLELKRKGPYKLEVYGHVNIGGNEVRVSYVYNWRVGPREMLDLFQEEFSDAIYELNSDNVTTAEEAVEFFMSAMEMMGSVSRSNSDIIVEEE